MGGMDGTHEGRTEPQLRAASYARLSETYDEAESVPTQLANADKARGAARVAGGGTVQRRWLFGVQGDQAG